MTLPIIIGFAALLVGAWYIDTRSWKKKSREELVLMVQSDDWRYHAAALKELRRRGENVAIYIPHIVKLLVAESKVDRTAAQMTIRDCFPELAREIQGYSPTSDLESCRAKAAPLLSRFGVGP
jgi:hypothetical protein